MTDEEMAQAVLGKDAEDFLSSELGRVVLGLAEQEAMEAYEELTTVSVWKFWRIRELQNRVWRASQFKNWLAEIITTGRQAIEAGE